MKLNLGSSIVALLLCGVLYAEDFTYTMHTSKIDPYVKEPILLELDINQTNHDHVLFFNFDINQSNHYHFFKSKMEESGEKHSLHIKYTYILYPLKSGDVKIAFTLIKKMTTDENIAYGFSGDRDNTKGMTTTNTRIHIPSLILHTKKLPAHTDIVGNFTLDYVLDKTSANPYAPISLNIKIEGEGYYPIIDKIISNNQSFNLFEDKPTIHFSHTLDNMTGYVLYPFALSASKDFSLDEIKIHGFDPNKDKKYILKIPKQAINITKESQALLVDKKNTPPPLGIDLHWLYDLLKIVFTFLVGYFTARTIKLSKKTTPTESNHTLLNKINTSKDAKALMRILLANGNKKYLPIIEKIEGNLYGNGKMNLKTLKREALEKMDA